jgi:hypothetical protein
VINIKELELYDDEDKNRGPIDKEARKIKFRLLGPLGQAHNIIVHIRGSPGQIEEFIMYAKRMVPMDNRTR